MAPPRWLIYTSLTLLCILLVPPALIARMRAENSEARRIHIIQDMDQQFKYKTQDVSPIFADQRTMRPMVPDTVARGGARTDDHFHRGVVGEDWVETFPSRITVDRTLLNRGEERFNIYCTPCHGGSGYGDGIVHLRANALLNEPARNNGTVWVAPKSLHEVGVNDQPVGQIYNTITNGVRTMAGYAAQISTEDRWAITAYVKALQRSQNASIDDIPADERQNLR